MKILNIIPSKDLGYIAESLPNQNLDEDFEFIFFGFNYFSNSEISKNSLI